MIDENDHRRLELWIFVTVVTQFRNQNEYSYQTTTLNCLPFNAMLCLENKFWSTPKSEIPTILPLLQGKEPVKSSWLVSWDD